jgi:glycosyltransferase involved in cell wall biosynthesis
MRVCYFGTYRESYSRNVIMIEALRRADVEVVECHHTLWHGLEDRIAIASGGWFNLNFIYRLIAAYWCLLKKHRGVGDYDVMVVGYPGQLDTFLARILTWMKHKPFVLDIFMSPYLVAFERGLVKRHPLSGRLLHLLESISYRLPDCLIQDSQAYVEWLAAEFKLDADCFRLVPTGADDRIFHPLDKPQDNTGCFRVLYYGSFIPNHGVPYIMDAVQVMRDAHDIMFTLVGEGPDKAAAQEFAMHHQLHNVEFIGWLPQSELISYIATADLCLGAFGKTPQSVMTVQNKIYECMAMRKPVVTGDSRALREDFTHLDQVYLVDRTNGLAITEAIQLLYEDAGLRERIASSGYALFMTKFKLDAQGQRFRSHLEELFKS